MLHFTFTQIKPLGFIAQYGFAGVDIFMMVSGLGLYYSLDKNCNILQFYKKRFIRIFPTYYLLGIFVSLLIYEDDLITYLFRYSTLGFWIGSVYGEWFIPSLIFLYLVAPYIKLLFDRNHFAIIITICITILITAYILVAKGLVPIYDPHFFLLYRIPAFILGMACAYWIKNGISPKFYIYILIIGIPFFILLFPNHHYNYNYKYLSLAFLLPTFTIIILYLIKHFGWINPLLSKLGDASFEIYIIQGFFSLALFLGKIVPPDRLHDIIAISLIVTSSLLGLTVHWLIKKVVFLT
jgi:peptidoglycan/LPS O-acetylase OafA/YrhL